MTVCGIGINDTHIRVKEIKREYQLWHNMLKRVTNHSKYPTYVDCKICDRWLSLSNFLEDIKGLEGYNEWLASTNKKRWSIDKDILGSGNKIYSPNTCKFIFQSDNSKEMIGRSGNPTKKKAVICIKGNGDKVAYESALSAEKDGFIQTCVTACCRGTRKKHKGCKFVYV